MVLVSPPENNEDNNTREEISNNHQDEEELEPPEEQKGFGTRGKIAQGNEGNRWWPSCYHKRYRIMDKTKFKDRIVWLKECRACGKKKVEVVYRDLNARRVYTGRDVFAVDPVVEDAGPSGRSS